MINKRKKFMLITTTSIVVVLIIVLLKFLSVAINALTPFEDLSLLEAVGAWVLLNSVYNFFSEENVT